MPEVEDTAADLTAAANESSASLPLSDTNADQAPKERTDKTREGVDPLKDQPPTVQNKLWIRYSKEELLALQESPLVKKPDALPPLAAWFGEIVKKENKKIPSDSTAEHDKRYLSTAAKQSHYNLEMD